MMAAHLMAIRAKVNYGFLLVTSACFPDDVIYNSLDNCEFFFEKNQRYGSSVFCRFGIFFLSTVTGDNTVTDVRGMRLKSLENVCFGNIGKTESLHNFFYWDIGTVSVARLSCLLVFFSLRLLYKQLIK